MTAKEVICMIVISICMLCIGYNVAILKFNKAIQRTLANISPNETDFTNGALWAVDYTFDAFYK